MSQPIVFNDTQNLSLSTPLPVAEPIGDLVSATAYHEHETAEGLSAGVWECSPGRWRRKVMQREFSHFIAGHCLFIPDHGTPIELRAGDAVLFPENCAGTWDVIETVRKTYLVL